ncbi:MAG: hypothetical protein ABJD66_04690 [Cellulophaga sp.]|uniref:hypothetical protein n=1 Tax=Cellulophaga sp. TaxID=1972202 RepID=UPI0032666EC0
MRNLILIITLIFLSSCAAKKNYLTDLNKIGLLGNVKYLKFINQNNEEREPADSNEEPGYIDNEYFFNKNGMITEQRQYISNELSQIFVFSYDNKNFLISKEYYNSEREIVTKSMFENKLNNKGKLYRQMEFRAWEKSLSDSTKVQYRIFPEEIIEFLYDNNGKLSQQKHYQSNTSFKYVIEYQDKRITKATTVDLIDNGIWSSTPYDCLKFDQNQNCIKYKDTGVKIEYYK